MTEPDDVSRVEKADLGSRPEATTQASSLEVPTKNEEIFELVYDGPNVADGTMSARELTEVLSGLTRAFSAVAHDKDLSDLYELRLRDVESNSFHLVFETVAFARANPVGSAALVTGAAFAWTVVKDTVSGSYRVITDIAKAIDAKKTLKGARLSTTPTTFDDDEVVLNLPDGIISLTKQQYELLLSRRIDKQISQIISPLRHDRIDQFKIKRASENLVEVNASQRDYFDYEEVTEATVREATEISGTFNSLTKSSRRGTFYTTDGVHVPYRYVGGDDTQLLRGFSAREPVRVRGRIKLDAQGVPSSIEVQEIKALQRNLLDE